MTFTPLLQADIEDFFELRITGAVPGPRGATGAETFILTDTAGKRYFAKRISDTIMQGRVRSGLALAAALADYGLSFVVPPLPGQDGHTFMHGRDLITLSPLIDGVTGRDYDPGLLGAALGAVHAATPFLDVPMPVQGHASVYDHFFRHGITAFLQDPVQDETPQGRLRRLILDNDQRLRRYRDVFFDLGEHTPKGCVATHGDMQGNILLSGAGGLYLIDWDEAELAPPERDLWLLANLPGFMQGYSAVRRDFVADPRELLHGALKAWLEGLAIQASIIINKQPGAAAAYERLVARKFSAERIARIDAAIARFDR